MQIILTEAEYRRLCKKGETQQSEEGFTRAELRVLRRALVLAQTELHNQIATCPSVVDYAEDIKALKKEQDIVKSVQARVISELRRKPAARANNG